MKVESHERACIFEHAKAVFFLLLILISKLARSTAITTSKPTQVNNRMAQSKAATASNLIIIYDLLFDLSKYSSIISNIFKSFPFTRIIVP